MQIIKTLTCGGFNVRSKTFSYLVLGGGPSLYSAIAHTFCMYKRHTMVITNHQYPKYTFCDRKWVQPNLCKN